MKLYDGCQAEEEVIALYGEKGIYPNVDFYSGIAYAAMELKQPCSRPIFAVSRVSGWAARVWNISLTTGFFRPRARYLGEQNQTWVPLEKR